jgi:hypothetical protein
MSVEADFFQARGANVFQAMGTTVGWNWPMADLNRYMNYAIVPNRANASVTINAITVNSDNNLRPSADFSVTTRSFDQGGTGICHLTFHAVRIPSL